MKRAAALDYARKGIRVLLCNGKVPLLRGHGYLDATDDTDIITQWWTEHPFANIGLVPGSAGLLVVDVDVKGEVNGHDSLDILEREHGKLPDTRTALTPSGGRHYYFRIPKGETFGNRKPIEGIDIRCDRGFAVAPPSEIDGKAYRWANENKTALLPDAWVELLRDKPYVPLTPTERPKHSNGSSRGGNLRKFLEVAYTDEGTALRNAIEGTRNDALNCYGFSLGQLVHLGLKAEDIIAQAEWAASRWSWTRGRPDPRKDRATIERAIQDGMRQPRKVVGHE
jgi:hypothetical protein